LPAVQADEEKAAQSSSAKHQQNVAASRWFL